MLSASPNPSEGGDFGLLKFKNYLIIVSFLSLPFGEI